MIAIPDIIALQMLNLVQTLLQIMFVRRVTSVQWAVKLLQNVLPEHINHIRSRLLVLLAQRGIIVLILLCKYQNNVKQGSIVELEKQTELFVLLVLSLLF